MGGFGIELEVEKLDSSKILTLLTAREVNGCFLQYRV